MRVETIAGPSAAPILLAEAKEHLRIDGEHEDSALSAFIAAAVQTVETYADIACMQRQLNIYQDCSGQSGQLGWWDGVADGPVSAMQGMRITLPTRPLISVDAVGFKPVNGEEALLPTQSYTAELGLEAALRLSSPLSENGTLRIVVTAGFGETWNMVPADIRHALLLVVTALYTKRGDEMTGSQSVLRQCGAEALLLPYRRVRI